jgi:hypothetical protein
VRFARQSLIPFPTPDRPTVGGNADIAHAALPLLRKLSLTLADAKRFLAECRTLEERATRKARKWGVPSLFFFEKRLQKEWEQIRPVSPLFPEPFSTEVAKRFPALAASWTILPDLLADTLTVLYSSRLTRRAARALPELQAGAKAIAPFLSDCRDLKELLAMPEDETVLAIDPIAKAGVRVRVRGIATVHEFHALLADAATMTFPGPRPSSDVVAAYRGTGLNQPEPPVMTARYQFFHPRALQADGTLPPGFAGSEHWIWGPEPLAIIPFVDGERTVLLGEPVSAMAWEAIRRFPFPAERLDVLESLNEREVAEWMQTHASVTAKPKALRKAA